MEFEALFSEWYSIVDPGFTGERVKLRLRAVAKIAGSLKLNSAVDLAATFYAQDPDPEFTKSIRFHIREADDTYVSHDRAELAVICAGVLYTLFEETSPMSHASALLVACGEFGGLHGSKRIDAIVSRARQYLIEESTRVREHALNFPSLADLLAPAILKLQAARENEDGEQTDSDPNLNIHADTLDALKTFGTNLTQSLELSEKRRLEESSILYWLLGGRVLNSDEPFKKIEKTRLAFIAAHDLAAQTQHLPGPASCNAILRSVVVLGKGTSQQASIQACLSTLSALDGEELLRHIKVLSPVFMPLSFGLQKAQEVNWNAGWEGAFTAQTKLKANASRSIDEISEQFYRELLLSRLLKEV
jgi:hypothetical protein